MNQRNDDLGTPLHVACYKDNMQAIEFLIKRRVTVNARDKHGASSLHRACACVTQKSSTEEAITHMLLQHQATLPRTIVSSQQSSAEAVEAVKMLLKHGAVLDAMDNRHETPLCVAGGVGNMSVLKILIEEGARVNMLSTDQKLGKYLKLQKFTIDL